MTIEEIVQQLFELIDREAHDMPREQYRELLEEISLDIEIRLDGLDADEEMDQ